MKRAADPFFVPAHRCPRCHRQVVTIEFRLAEREVVMQSCSRCDQRWYQAGGRLTDIVRVIGRDPIRQPALR